jgi:glucose/arabinose dehydrogenase
VRFGGARAAPLGRVSPMWVAALCAALVGCSDVATVPVTAGMGAVPALPTEVHRWPPTLNIAPAIGWIEGSAPQAAAGMQVKAFARELDHPRWVLVLPNGDVLVAETGEPPKPDGGKGLRGWFMGLAMARAGAAVPSANRITLLRDTNGDGIADVRTVLIEGLNSPFGMVLVGSRLFVADTDAVLSFPYRTGDTRILERPEKLTALPAGPINHHWTKNLIASADGHTLYVSVGSNSNVGERGVEAEAERAAIWAVDIATGSHRIYANGLRDPNGMAIEPTGGALWAVVNERDELGSDLVPDYLTSVRDGAFYGWPYSYFGQHVDERVRPARPELVEQALVPDYALGPHTASLGLTAAAATALPEAYRHGMFIGQHGSWNREPASGYKVIFVPFDAGRPSGAAVDVLTGFLDPKGRAQGRPVGVAVDGLGALLVADDVGNVVWRVTAQPAVRQSASGSVH